MHILKTACSLFDEVVVGIGINPNKARRFNKEEMKNAIEKTIESEKITNVKVVVYDGYTAEKAKEMGAARMRSTRFFFADRIFRGGKPCGFLLFIAFRSIAVLSLSTYVYTPSGREATISALNQASPKRSFALRIQHLEIRYSTVTDFARSRG